MTPDRFRRLRKVLEQRQPDLTVLMDSVHKAHNLSAIVRSCDAVGVLEAHAVWPDPALRAHHHTAGGASRWVPVRTHPDLETAARALRSSGHRLVAAHPAEGARDYLEVDYTRPTAFLLGAELDGISARGLELADLHVAIPMAGHVRSLNVSVAGALLLFEARRQRAAAGLYDASRLDTERFRCTLFEWAHPEVADYCRRHRRPYPVLDDEGSILDPQGFRARR